MSSRSLLSSCLFAAMLAAVSASAFAGPPARGIPQLPLPADRTHGDGLSDSRLSDSVRRVERSTRAQVLSAEQVPFDGRNVNRIKTVDERGRVRVFMDDPRSGHPPRQDDPTRGNDD